MEVLPPVGIAKAGQVFPKVSSNKIFELDVALT